MSFIAATWPSRVMANMPLRRLSTIERKNRSGTDVVGRAWAFFVAFLVTAADDFFGVPGLAVRFGTERAETTGRAGVVAVRREPRDDGRVAM